MPPPAWLAKIQTQAFRDATHAAKLLPYWISKRVFTDFRARHRSALGSVRRLGESTDCGWVPARPFLSIVARGEVREAFL